MTTRIEQLRQRYDQFSRGDIRGATQDWADDFVWQGGHSAELPMGGKHSGKGALGAAGSRAGRRRLGRIHDVSRRILRGRRHGERLGYQRRGRKSRQVGHDNLRPHLALVRATGSVTSSS